MKTNLLLLCITISLLVCSCDKDKKDTVGGHVHQGGGNLASIHAPATPNDSVVFTADSGALRLLLFSPLGGSYHVVVHDLTSSIDLFNGDVSTSDQNVAGFLPGHSYYVMCYSNSGASVSNFTHVTSSYRNSGMTPTPFCGYTQYYNSNSNLGPNDGCVVILQDYPENGQPKVK